LALGLLGLVPSVSNEIIKQKVQCSVGYILETGTDPWLSRWSIWFKLWLYIDQFQYITIVFQKIIIERR
jgi:hypothetical protein